MELLSQIKPRWWQAPRRLSERDDERRVTWLELLYDLVYVALIGRIAIGLASNMQPRAIEGFIFLFTIVWVAWFNGSLHYDLHGKNDLTTRLFTFLQMGAVAGMAVFGSQALTVTASGFAFFLAGYLLILAVLWWRSGLYEPALRVLSYPNAIAIFITALLFMLSIFIPSTWRIPLWGAGLVVMLFVPLVRMLRYGDDPEIGGPDTLIGGVSYALSERFGLLTLIVLGQFMVDIIEGAAVHEGGGALVWVLFVAAGLVALTFWWIYFDFVAMHLPRIWLGYQTAWMYLHWPMTLGLVASAAAILDVLEYAGQPVDADVRLVLIGGMALALLAVACLMACIQVRPRLRTAYRRGSIVTALCGALLLLLALSQLDGVPLLLAILLLLAFPVMVSAPVWLDALGEQDTPA